ncbi:hypothetical protein [Sporosarcina sp. ITBMC105]
MVIHQHGLNRSIVMHLRDAMAMRVDLVFDGYKMPAEKPYVTVEQMPAGNAILSKGREAVAVTYRYQIGLHDVNSVQLSVNQERLQRIFNFDEFTYYDTLQTPFVAEGVFMCELTGVVPMPAEDISKQADYHRVYFDVEVATVTRK